MGRSGTNTGRCGTSSAFSGTSIASIPVLIMGMLVPGVCVLIEQPFVLPQLRATWCAVLRACVVRRDVRY
eukprot:2409567-Rhodomonas_salina.2